MDLGYVWFLSMCGSRACLVLGLVWYLGMCGSLVRAVPGHVFSTTADRRVTETRGNIHRFSHVTLIAMVFTFAEGSVNKHTGPFLVEEGCVYTSVTRSRERAIY